MTKRTRSKIAPPARPTLPPSEPSTAADVDVRTRLRQVLADPLSTTGDIVRAAKYLEELGQAGEDAALEVLREVVELTDDVLDDEVDAATAAYVMLVATRDDARERYPKTWTAVQHAARALRRDRPPLAELLALREAAVEPEDAPEAVERREPPAEAPVRPSEAQDAPVAADRPLAPPGIDPGDPSVAWQSARGRGPVSRFFGEA